MIPYTANCSFPCLRYAALKIKLPHSSGSIWSIYYQTVDWKTENTKNNQLITRVVEHKMRRKTVGHFVPVFLIVCLIVCVSAFQQRTNWIGQKNANPGCFSSHGIANYWDCKSKACRDFQRSAADSPPEPHTDIEQWVRIAWARLTVSVGWGFEKLWLAAHGRMETLDRSYGHL